MSRLLVIVMAGCGTQATPPGVDATPEPTVTVVFNWKHFDTQAMCTMEPTCSTDTCGTMTGCTCLACPSFCSQMPVTEKCCSASHTFAMGKLGKLAADYPTCDLAQTSPITYSLTCGVADAPTHYSGMASTIQGMQLAYTDDQSCAWLPPYATL